MAGRIEPPNLGSAHRAGLRGLRSSVLLALGVAATAAAVWSGSVRGWDRPVPAQGPEPEVAEPDVTSEAIGEQLVLRQLLVRDRLRQRDLERAVEELRAGDRVEAFTALQRLLDEPDDVFVWDEADGRLTSIRSELLSLFAGLDRDGLEMYQRLHGPEADRLLAQARRSNDPGEYREVARRYYFTAAGFAATNWLASHAFDQGRFGHAARLWQELLSAPGHRRRIGPAITAKAALATQMAGRPQEAARLLQEMGTAQIRIGGRQVNAAEHITANFLDADQEVGSEGIALASRSEIRPELVTVPYLRAVWTAEHGKNGGSVRPHVEEWRSDQMAGGESIAVANQPAVLGDTVFVRDFGGIRALHLRTGETIWRYEDRKSLARTALATPDNRRGSGRPDLETAYTGNSSLGTLVSDGRRLYALDLMDLTAPDPHRSRNLFDRHSRVALPESFQGGNRLIAIDLAAAELQRSDIQPTWSVGGPEDASDRLSGHFFLGPPLAAADRLFAITESNRQLNVVCLDAPTGDVCWIQPLSFVELPVDLDVTRFPLACTPVLADGVLVCPTQSEILVALDPDRGVLLWSYYYGDRADSRALGRWPRGGRSTHGHPGFANVPHVHDGHVLYMPRQSSRVHCVDLVSGRPVWEISPPRMDGEYIGTVTGRLVLIVGSRTCRALDRHTGEELWSLPFGVPSGRGITAGRHYLLPLQEGRVATIDLQTGDEVGLTEGTIELVAATAESEERHIPGNLAAAEGMIVSVDALGVAVYPQAASLLEQVREDLDRDPANPDHHLLAAELEISLGRIASGKARLQTALGAATSPTDRERGEHLLRELLYRELRSGAADEQRVLSQLAQLADTTSERARLLMETAESQLRRGEPEMALQSVRRFAELRIEDLIPVTGEPGWHVSAGGWIASAMRRTQEQLGASAQDRLHVEVELAQQAALQSGRIAELEGFLRLYPDFPSAAQVRLELAERLVVHGELQRAELLLLRNRGSDDRGVAASATRSLAALWDTLGLSHQAARLLAELRERYGSVRLEDSTAGADVVAAWSNESLAKVALQRLHGPEWPVRDVEIASVLWSRNDPEVTETFNRFRRKYETPAGSPFHLLDKGTQNSSLITVVDQTSGMTRGRIEVPNAQNVANVVESSHVGHFFPLGSPAAMHGVSLLELSSGKPLWTTAPRNFGHRRDLLRAGPAGPTFAAFQARQHLTVVDPGTGRILWQRSDLDPASGLVGDPYAGLIGDEEVLVLFGGDRRTYNVFRTDTGEELRRGKLDLDPRQQRRVFGRKLFHIQNSPLGRRMRIWDPLIDRMVMDEPVGRRPLAVVTPDNELAVVLPAESTTEGENSNERLQIVDVHTGELRVELPLSGDDVENLNYVRAFRDGDRYFINLQRAISAPRARRYSSYVSDSHVDAVHVQGDLLAVDAHTGRLLWRRDVPQRSLLQFPQVRLPFLVALSRIGDRWRGNQLSLAIEIIDSATGQTLASEDELFLDNRILYSQYDHEQGRLELHGTKSVIELRFGPRFQQVPSDGRPL